MRARLVEAEATLAAIRSGAVDALVIQGEAGERVFTLASADQTFRELAERMSDGAATLDPDGVILWANAALDQVLRTELGTLVGQTLQARIPASEAGLLFALAEAASQPMVANGLIEAATGELVPIRLSVARVTIGQASGRSVILTDLSSQRRTEALLRRAIAGDGPAAVAAGSIRQLDGGAAAMQPPRPGTGRDAPAGPSHGKRGRTAGRSRGIPATTPGGPPPAATWRDRMAASDAITLVVDPSDGQIVEASQGAADFYGYSRESLKTMRLSQINTAAPSTLAAHTQAAASGPGLERARVSHRLASGEVRLVEVHSGPIVIDGRHLLQGVIHDVTALEAAEALRDVLAAAISQTSESVVITDPSAAIVYVNPAFERASGWSSAEVLGMNPRVLKSGAHDPAFYEAMWSTLTAGWTWRGELVNRRKDGRIYFEEASIAPVLGRDGELRNYVAVKRDVTTSRLLESSLQHARSDSRLLTATLSDIHESDTPEATAAGICDRLLSMPGIVFASIALFDSRGGGVHVLSAQGPDRAEIEVAKRDQRWSAAFRERTNALRVLADVDPIVQPWEAGTVSPMASTFARLGVAAIAVAGLRLGGRVVGFLEVGTGGVDGRVELERELGSVTAFARLASFLLERQAKRSPTSTAARAEMERTIRDRAFRPVFQPIVSLATGEVLGYEALTRFSNGTPPDAAFAEAAAHGLGTALELATLESALRAAGRLPQGAWLDINVSPSLLATPDALADVLDGAADRGLVLEITEHEQIASYVDVRSQLACLRQPVRLAVDDAGAGFASLRHIVELSPDLIKIDRSLVTGIDGDAVRQGLVAGIVHFARVAHASLVAEGIETESERLTMLDLGVEHGQGYLFGRPASAVRVARHAVPPAAGSRRRRQADGRVSSILWEADGTDERMTYVSDTATAVTGHPASEWLATPRFWEDHVHPDDRDAALHAVNAVIETGHHAALEYRFRLADGTYRWFEDMIEVLPDGQGHRRLVGVMVDVTARRVLKDELAWRTSHDALTHLLTRPAFEAAIAQEAERRPQIQRAIVLVELPTLKGISNRFGHDVGDRVLTDVARRMESATRSGDLVARFGNDELVVCIAAPDEDAAGQLARRIVDVATVPSRVDRYLVAHPAVGGVAFLETGTSVDESVRRAASAASAAPSGASVAFWSPATQIPDREPGPI